MKNIIRLSSLALLCSLIILARSSVYSSPVTYTAQESVVVPVAEITQQPVVVENAPIIAEKLEKWIKVNEGENLSIVAEANNVSVQRLYDANADIADPNIISVGQRIRIPSEDEVLEVRAMPVPTPKVTLVESVEVSTPAQIVSSAPTVAGDSVWDRLSLCEAGGVWSRNSGNGYYGGLQFSLSTWRAVGGQGLPSENTREEQIYRAEILLARSGWGQWPACSQKLGLL